MIESLFDQIYSILDGDDVYEVCMQDGSMGKDVLAGRLVELFNRLDVNRCDFDCDNCHNGGCGNPACDRGGCPEENAARDAEDKAWAAAQAEGHTVLDCQTCMTSVCRLVNDD